jgi:hypothetical protein
MFLVAAVFLIAAYLTNKGAKPASEPTALDEQIRLMRAEITEVNRRLQT